MYTFNEAWGEFDPQKVVQLAKSLAPDHLWGAASGWIDPQDRTMTDRTYEHAKGYVSSLSHTFTFRESRYVDFRPQQ